MMTHTGKQDCSILATASSLKVIRSQNNDLVGIAKKN